MNPNFVTDLHIQNFKSIKDLKLDCKRINLFIGKPNVGKSNILEAISLLSEGSEFEKDFSKQLRYNRLHNLYFESETQNPVLIESKDKITLIVYNKSAKIFFSFVVNMRNIFGDANTFKKSYIINFLQEPIARLTYLNSSALNSDFYKELLRLILTKFKHALVLGDLKYQLNLDDIEMNISLTSYDVEGNLVKDYSYGKYGSTVKYYKFQEKYLTISNAEEELIWPNGNNIINVLERNKLLRIQVGEIFNEYGYELVIDKTSGEIEIQKSVDNIVFKLPLDFVADTLRRFIFHLAAIKSNQNTVLILEEPEAHSFPEYISIIAEEIIKSETNQFFIATHSPYILNEILEKANRDEVAIHLTYFENYQTKVKTLSNDELSELADYGVDIFFNLENYLHDVKQQ